MENLIKLIPSSGMVLTTWKEGDSIARFSYASEVICDRTANIEAYRLMSIEDAKAKEAEALNAFETMVINAELITVGESGATSGSTIEVVE